MSHEQRAALRDLAHERGTTLTALVLETLAPLTGPEQRAG